MAGVRTERKLTCKEGNEFEYLDAPGLKSPNMDVRVDITDIFTFQNPAEPTRSFLAVSLITRVRGRVILRSWWLEIEHSATCDISGDQ